VCPLHGGLSPICQTGRSPITLQLSLRPLADRPPNPKINGLNKLAAGITCQHDVMSGVDWIRVQGCEQR
jgi:hypothetical protein